MRKNDCFLPRLAAVVCAAAFLLCTIPGQAQPTPQVLHNHVRAVVTSGQAVPVGHLPSTQRLQLAIMLPLRNQAELTSLLDRLYAPTSPDYRQFLSVAQFTKRFGPTEQDYQAVVDFAKANGFTVTNRPPNRLLVDVSGSVAQIEKAFHVAMMVYRHPTEDRTFYSPDREPALELSVPVSYIEGLDNFHLPRSHRRRAPVGEESKYSMTGSGPHGQFLGSDMRAAYYGSGPLTGSGQAVGLFEYYGYEMSDVDAYFSAVEQTNSVPINPVLLNNMSASCLSPHCDDSEQVLDIVQAISMAPGLSQLLVYIGERDADILNKMASDNIAKQLSCSWGTDVQPAIDDPIFQEMAAQGQIFLVASGDNGAFTGNNNRDGGVYPADDVYTTAVGATDLTTNGPGGSWASERAWVDSGGGSSDNGIAFPSWQDGVPNSSNDASTTLRNVPDVAAEGNTDNFACSDQSGCYGGDGGTSYAAPRWAGFLALVNQQAVAGGYSSVGFINPAIYAIGEGLDYDSDFHDIASGNNHCCGQTVWWNAVTGYDDVTGWGSPNGQNLIDALVAASRPPGFSLTATPNALTVAQGKSGTSTIAIVPVNTFDQSVTLHVGRLPRGVTASFSVNPATSSSTLTLTASGSAKAGSRSITIIGKSGSLTHRTTRVALTVTAP